MYALTVRDINPCLLGNGPIYLLSKAECVEKSELVPSGSSAVFLTPGKVGRCRREAVGNSFTSSLTARESITLRVSPAGEMFFTPLCHLVGAEGEK